MVFLVAIWKIASLFTTQIMNSSLQNREKMHLKNSYMIKKTVLLFVLVLCVFINTKAQVSIAPKAGVNMARIVGNDNDLNPKILILPELGCIVNFDLYKNFALQSGISYSIKGEKMKSYEGTPSKYYLHYLEIPANAVYSIKLNQNRLQLFAGPYFGYCLKASLDMGGVNSTDLGVGNSEEDVFKSVDYGYNLGIGYRLNKLQVQIGYQKSFATINNWGDMKNRVFSITCAYFFDFGKKN